MAQVKDPVCGMMIDDKTAAGRSEYNGTGYYFCSKSCKLKFDESPAKYAATSGSGSSGSTDRR